MKIETKESQGIQIVAFEGNLDTNSSPEAEAKINELLDAGKQKLLVNFEQLNFISSAGLRVLLATVKKLNANGGDLRVCSLNETVRAVFDISGFVTILNVKSTEEEALSSF